MPAQHAREPHRPVSAPPRLSPLIEVEGVVSSEVVLRKVVASLGYSVEGRLVRVVEKLARGQLEGAPVLVYLRGLSQAALAELEYRWQTPCEDMFDLLAAVFPSDLLAMIEGGGLDVVQLSLAAERAAQVEDHDAVRAVLIPLLSHARAVVRGGAIYGLHDHVDDEVRAMLKQLAATDPSDGVRQAAVDALQEL